MKPVPAIVQQDESERSLIERARQAESHTGWTIGECASLWTARYARGRTDADFAAMIGSSQQRVNEARRVHDQYGEVYRSTGKLSFSHYCTVLGSDHAADALEWAVENEATVSEMRAWLRMQDGENLTTATTDDETSVEVTQSLSAVGHDPAEQRQRGDKPAPVIGIPPEQINRDRTKQAAARDDDERIAAIRQARAFFRAAVKLCEMGLREGCQSLAREVGIEAQEQGEIELPDDRTLAALLQLGDRR